MERCFALRARSASTVSIGAVIAVSPPSHSGKGLRTKHGEECRPLDTAGLRRHRPRTRLRNGWTVGLVQGLYQPRSRLHLVGSGYQQFCPVTKAMEVLDERWMLLVIRELV